LWERVGKGLPKTNRKNLDITTWVPPAELEGALFSLYESYQHSFAHWREDLEALGEPPPVFIVVCPNTAVSKLVFDWIAGTEKSLDDGTAKHVPGKLELFDNAPGGHRLARPRTILIDSAQLESGEGLSKEFKASAASEIDTFKAAWRLRNPGGDTESITDEDLLREVMNTVGKPDSLGSDVRCVVSVSMLTEGWDANTVTHILGIRAFGSQLLCEQVVGRGLRRRTYVTDDSGRFPAEYANVYGVPFAFIPSDMPPPTSKPAALAVEVRTVAGRESQRITFPHVAGYRFEIADPEMVLSDELEPFEIGPQTVPTWTDAAPLVGAVERIADDVATLRPRAVAYRLARRLVRREFAYGDEIPGFSTPNGEAAEHDGHDVSRADSPSREDQRPWLFPTLVRLCQQWLDEAVHVAPGFHLGYLAKYALWEAKAADAVFRAVISQHESGAMRILPLLRQFEPVGATGNVSFVTRKATVTTDPDRCEISHVVLDGPGGNTWEQLAMAFCEKAGSPVAAYAKNDHLGFRIPYVHQGVSHDYVPDFLLRLRRRDGDRVDRTLIVEVSGGQKQKHSPGSTAMKAAVARDSWCPAVNNHGGFGRWGYVEVTDPVTMNDVLTDAVENLYEDRAIIGPPDLLDLAGMAARDERGSYAATR
jgi:type III restriction enzyme